MLFPYDPGQGPDRFTLRLWKSVVEVPFLILVLPDQD